MATMMINNINTWTKNFLQMNFAEYHHLIPKDDDSHPVDSILPAVEIPGLSLQKISAVYEHCRHMPLEAWSLPGTEQFFSDWCFPSRFSGLTNIVIKTHTFTLPSYWGNTGQSWSSPITADDNLISLVRDLLADWWSNIFSIRINRLEPKGWFDPHRDQFDRPWNLCHFWIPLHDFVPGLRVFPMGWLNHRLGSMYLFNQCRYPHALINQQDQPRYVIIGKFQPESMPADIMEKFATHRSEFMKIWI